MQPATASAGVSVLPSLLETFFLAGIGRAGEIGHVWLSPDLAALGLTDLDLTALGLAFASLVCSHSCPQTWQGKILPFDLLSSQHA